MKGKHRRRVFLVNRSGNELLGEPAYRSLSDLPEPVEMVVIAIGAAGFEAAVDDALRAGARAIVAITAGLGEAGSAGRGIEKHVVERVHAAGAVLVGPNCLGVADTGTDLNLAYGDQRAGPVALISQSGNLALELVLLAGEAGLGLSRFVSVGNQADLDVTELIEAFADHEPTRVIAVYVEDFRDGRAFVRAAIRAGDLGKPVVLLTVGSSRAGAQAALSHTGALVSASVAVDAACRAGGIMRAGSPREMIDLAQGLLMPRPPGGRRLAVVGDGGGHVALAADIATDHGLELPVLSPALAALVGSTLPPSAATRNPIDLAGGGEQDFFNYARVVRTLCASREVDAVLLTGYFGGYSEDAAELAQIEAKVAGALAGAADGTECAVVVQTMYPGSLTLQSLRSAHVPIYGDIRAAVSVLARLAGRSEQTPRGVPTLPAAVPSALAREGYFESRKLMAEAGIPFLEAREVKTQAAARAAAASIGFPVVLKALGASHKSDAGGVRLGIAGEVELDAAFTDMAARLAPASWSVERMASAGDGFELLVGVRRDHSFGPLVVVGVGGFYAELLQDVAVALAPVSEDLAAQLIHSLRAAPLMQGARGGAVLDVAAAAVVVAALSRLAADRPDIAEAEVNPLLVGRDGVVALDARVVAAGL